jgi:hypothetical protein
MGSSCGEMSRVYRAGAHTLRSRGTQQRPTVIWREDRGAAHTRVARCKWHGGVGDVHATMPDPAVWLWAQEPEVKDGATPACWAAIQPRRSTHGAGLLYAGVRFDDRAGWVCCGLRAGRCWEEEGARR